MLRNPSGVVYGTITVGALLAAESAQGATYLETAEAVLLTMISFWLAHAYADYTGERLREGEKIRLKSFAGSLWHELSILSGAVVPLLAVLIADVVDASLADAITVGVWTAAVMVMVIELVSGIRAELSGRDLALQTALGGVLGLLVIAIHVVLH